MRWRRPLRLLVPLLLILMTGMLVLQGITLSRQRAKASSAAQLQLPDASSRAQLEFPESSIDADCGLSQLVGAWIDRNANGQREPDEPPLAGVEFFVVSNTTGQDPWDYGRMAVSDDIGEGHVSAFIGGCGKQTFDISARPPAGYRATAAEHMLLESYGIDRRIEFGFVAAP